ncbi:MAG: bifunctional DNA-binding transcriptional regulator/O6-methylguanine-DNA methyltransferase Ada [Myxococcota bacterium]
MTDVGDRFHDPSLHHAEARWRAVLARDRSADGRFFYSVRTTGVYCRPSCPARRPRREHVRFHDTRIDAERAGFRACKRCRPQDPPLREQHATKVAHACRVIEAAGEEPRLSALASAAGMSPHHFHRVFKEVTGLTPRAYAAAHRARRVREELGVASSVTDAMYGAGFNASGRFYAMADRALGMSPSEYRAGGSNAVIRFAVGECSLGSVLVAATDRGVCAILLGDDPEALVADLEGRFPRAELVGGDRRFEETVAVVAGMVDDPGTHIDLPLDLRGSAFQARVWQALSEIPAGTTATYGEIGRRLGMAHGARAVARACAANPLAVAIPCHRVVRRDGEPGGYRWGVERKRALLRREARKGAAT